MSKESDETLFAEKLAGASLRRLETMHGIPRESVRVAILRQANKVLTQIELDLLRAKVNDEYPSFIIPATSGPDFDMAVELVKFVVNGLHERGVRVKLHYRPAFDQDKGEVVGMVLWLEEADSDG